MSSNWHAACFRFLYPATLGQPTETVMHKTALLLIACLVGLSACDDDLDTDLDGTDTEIEATVNFGMNVRDFVTLEPVSGLEIEYGDQAFVTTSDGGLAIPVPANGPVAINSTNSDYPDTYWHFASAEDDFSIGTFMVSRQTAGQIMGALGQTLDPSKGILVVAIFGPESGFVPGATVDLDAEYSAAIVADSGSQIGFSVGNKTLEGSSAWVVFLNVEAGDATPTVTLADQALDCGVFPSGADAGPIAIRGDSLNHFHYQCN
ncbi:MAG: hypothetical protein ACI9MC_003156 [Kiritimatiellia bacterium]